MKHQRKENVIKEGDVVLIKGDERNRGKWNVGIVEQLVKGRDGVIRVVKLRTKKAEIERAIQLLYPLELACDVDTQCKDVDTQCKDVDTQCKDVSLDPKAKEFKPRRKAAKIAEDNVKQTFLYEDEQS